LLQHSACVETTSLITLTRPESAGLRELLETNKTTSSQAAPLVALQQQQHKAAQAA
jgi:hypothetical protein